MQFLSIKHYLCLLLLGGLMFTSCDNLIDLSGEQDILNEEKNLDLSTLVTVEDGILTFNSYADFKNVENYLATNPNATKELKELFEDFNSYQSSFEQMILDNNFSEENNRFYNWVEEDGERYLYPMIKHPIYTSLFNAEGLLKLGDNILQYSNENLAIIKANDYQEGIEIQQLKGARILELPNESEVALRNITTCVNDYEFKNNYPSRRMKGYRTPSYSMVIPDIEVEPVFFDIEYVEFDIDIEDVEFEYDGYDNVNTANFVKSNNSWLPSVASRIGVEEASSRSNSPLFVWARPGCCNTGRSTHFVIMGGVKYTCVIDL